MVLLELDRPAEALESLQRSLEHEPLAVPTLVNHGIALLALHRHAEALDSFSRAAGLTPDDPEIHALRAKARVALRQFAAAVTDYTAALRLQPRHAQVRFDGAMVLMRLRRYREAISWLEKLAELDPRYPYAAGAAFFARAQLCDWRDYDSRRWSLLDAIARGEPAATPFHLLCATDVAQLHLQCARANTQARFPAGPAIHGGPAPSAKSSSRIRLGYVSGDLRNHAVAHLLVGVIEQHDRAQFEVSAISLQPATTDTPGTRIHAAFDRFHDVGSLTDAGIAALVRDLGIDILVDLAGYTDGHRLGIFAHRPAPVQVTWLGFAGTCGAPYIDYLLADSMVMPVGADNGYAEQLVRLPGCYLPNDDRRAIAVVPTRKVAGLPEGAFVFCAFTNPYKINPAIFNVWMRVLAAVPGSILWLRSMGEDAAFNLRTAARARGIAAERLLFAPHVPAMPAHLARLALADLYLDTVPYNAHSTTCDALWSGVPVITCRGEGFAARVAASALTAAGLPELICADLAAYERCACELAGDPARLTQLRKRVAAARSSSSLFDTARFTRQLESAYATMWATARRGAAPAAFVVELVR